MRRYLTSIALIPLVLAGQLQPVRCASALAKGRASHHPMPCCASKSCCMAGGCAGTGRCASESGLPAASGSPCFRSGQCGSHAPASMPTGLGPGIVTPAWRHRAPALRWVALTATSRDAPALLFEPADPPPRA